MENFYYSLTSEQDKESLFKALKKVDSLGIFKPENTSLSVESVCFYSNCKILKATSLTSIPPYTDRFLMKRDSSDWWLVRLAEIEWKEQIFEFNSKAGVVINSDTVIKYLKFALDLLFIKTKDANGTLRLIDGKYDVKITRNAPEKEKEVYEIVRPARVKQVGKVFECDAIVFHDHKIYNHIITVDKNGVFDIKDEKLLAENMPIRPILIY